MGGEVGGVRGAPTRVGVGGIIKRGENKFEISVHPRPAGLSSFALILTLILKCLEVIPVGSRKNSLTY